MSANFLPDYSINPDFYQCWVTYDFIIAVALVQANSHESQRINISHSKLQTGAKVFESSEKIWFCIFFYFNVSFKLSSDIHACQDYLEKYLSIPGLMVNKQNLISYNHIKYTLSFAQQCGVELYQSLRFSQKGSVVHAKSTSFKKKKKLNCVFWWLITKQVNSVAQDKYQLLITGIVLFSF